MKNDEEYTKENSRAQLTIERALKSSKEKNEERKYLCRKANSLKGFPAATPADGVQRPAVEDLGSETSSPARQPIQCFDSSS